MQCTLFGLILTRFSTQDFLSSAEDGESGFYGVVDDGVFYMTSLSPKKATHFEIEVGGQLQINARGKDGALRAEGFISEMTLALKNCSVTDEMVRAQGGPTAEQMVDLIAQTSGVAGEIPAGKVNSRP